MDKRILIVNKFYYNRGGDCVCTLNLEQMLRDKDVEVAVYAMQYPENKYSEYSKFFVSEVDFSGSIASKLKAVKRIFGYGDIVKSFNHILDEFNPDIVHLQNIHSYISPVVARLAKLRGCKVVWTLHDYKLLCPSYACLNNGLPCEKCFRDKKWVIKDRCMKGSLTASFIAYLEAVKWNRKKLEKYTDSFICPSRFMADKMASGGFDRKNLQVINNFIDPVKMETFSLMDDLKKEDYYVYVGRLSVEKGIETLLKVASELPYNIKVLGSGPLHDKLVKEYQEFANIEFLGHCNSEDVCKLLSKAKFSVMPSECYENNPLSIIESLCIGTPVVGADTGGIPELIDNFNGITFTSGSEKDMHRAIDLAFSKEWDSQIIKKNAMDKFSSEAYYDKIVKVYLS